MSTAEPVGLAIAHRERLDDCVHCGLCLTACPTYLELANEADSPRGRIQLMQMLARGDVAPTPEVVQHLDACLGCRACESACPSGVRYGSVLEATRHALRQQAPGSLRVRLRRRVIETLMPQPSRLRLALAPVRWMEKAGLRAPLDRVSRWVRMLPEAPTAPATFVERYLPEGTPRARVALFVGCVTQTMFPQLNQATLRVLLRNGCEVWVPPRQGCCGALQLHGGDHDGACARARHNLAAFAGDVDAIVVNTAGCGALLKEYGELLAETPALAEAAQRFAGRVRDVSEWLMQLGLVPPTRPVARRVAYHDACHLAHGQGIRVQPRTLLAAIPGLELVELGESEVCCGSAGSYNLTQPELADRLGRRKARHVLDSGADVVAAGNPGCVLQIRGSLSRLGQPRPVVHPVEILAEAYGDTPDGVEVGAQQPGLNRPRG